MNNWIRKTIEKTSWGRFLIWIILYIGGSIWAFAMPGAWKTLGELTGTENGIPKIPSTLSGFHENQPMLAFTQIGEAMDQYFLFQLIDLPLAFIASMLMITIISAGLKRFSLTTTPFRYILIIPLLYLLAEFIENTLLAGMAAKIIPTAGEIITVQQSVTTAKRTLNLASEVNVIVAALALAIGLLFKKRSPKQ